MQNSSHQDAQPRSQRIQLGATSVRPDRVLVVEDDPSVRMLLDIVLREKKLAVWISSDGYQMLKAHSRYSADIDFVMLDVRMPRAAGARAARGVQQPLHDCVLAADGGVLRENDLLESGAERIIYRRFRPNALARFFQQLIVESKRGIHVFLCRCQSRSV